METFGSGFCSHYQRKIDELESIIGNAPANPLNIPQRYDLITQYFFITTECPGQRVNYELAIKEHAAQFPPDPNLVWGQSRKYLVKNPLIKPFIGIKFLEAFYGARQEELIQKMAGDRIFMALALDHVPSMLFKYVALAQENRFNFDSFNLVYIAGEY